MAKKRKSVTTRLDEADRTVCSSFCNTANSLTHLYSHTMNQQKLSFQAGEEHALDKLYKWIIREQEEGSRVTTLDIVAHLQNELEYGAEENAQTATQTNIDASIPSTAFGATVVGQGGICTGQFDQQAKNSVFSNALSSPLRHSLQPYHLAQGSVPSSNTMSSENGTMNNEMSFPSGQNMDTKFSNSNDCMEMLS